MSTPNLKPNNRGGYRFLPGIEPYCCGVVADSGFEIVHATLASPLPWRDGMRDVRNFLLKSELHEQNLCGVELRCPTPHPMSGFVAFNTQYRDVLESWDVIVDGDNPVARTNVAPVVDPPGETMLFGFSYCEPSDCPRPTFVVAGGGELPEGGLDERRIVRLGETSPEAMVAKAECVVGLMRARMLALGGGDRLLSTIDVYTAHPLRSLLEQVVVPALPAAAELGVHWFYSQPPVAGIEFEMDMRGVRRERVIGPEM